MDSEGAAGEGFAWAEVDPANCSIGHAVGAVGDPWALLVLRDVAFEVDRFDALQRHLGVSRRTLAERLEALVARGVVERVPYKEPGQRTRHRYRLTPSGEDLLPLLLALGAWGDRHRPDDGGPPVVVAHRGCGAPVAVHLRCAAGHEVAAAAEVAAVRGPGATPVPARGAPSPPAP